MIVTGEVKRWVSDGGVGRGYVRRPDRHSPDIAILETVARECLGLDTIPAGTRVRVYTEGLGTVAFKVEIAD